MNTTRAPCLPRDFYPRFFNAACLMLTFDRYLQGGEPLRVLGARHEGPLELALPRLHPQIKIGWRAIPSDHPSTWKRF